MTAGEATTSTPSPTEPTEATEPTQSQPPVSVVVPTRDRERLVARAVARIAEQDYPGAIEVLVVRDAAEPDPRAEAALLRAIDVLLGGRVPERVAVRQLVNERSRGLPGNRNTGILAASHELVAFCDDDDEWLPGKLSAQVPLLLDDPAASLAATGVTIVHDGAQRPRPGPLRPTTLQDLLLRRTMELHPSTFLLRRADLLGAIGLVDEGLPGGYAEDYDLLLRAAGLGPVLSVPLPLVRINWHAASYYFSTWQTIHDGLDALLAKHPQFADVPRGRARIRGQQAVAMAAMGRRRDALRIAGDALRLSPREPRAYVAAAVASGAVSVEGVQRFLHRRGRGL